MAISAEEMSKIAVPPVLQNTQQRQTPPSVQNTLGAKPASRVLSAQQMMQQTVSPAELPKNIPQSRDSRIAEGLPVGSQARFDRTGDATPSFGGTLARGALAGPATLLATATSGFRKPKEGEGPIQARPMKSEFFGDVKPLQSGLSEGLNKGLAQEQETGRASDALLPTLGGALKSTAASMGTGLEVGSFAIGAGPVAGIARQGAKQFAKQGVGNLIKQTAKTEAVAGATGAFGASLREGDSVGNTILNTVLGGAIGGVAGGVIAGVGRGIGRGRQLATAGGRKEIASDRIKSITTKREKELLDIENNYSVTRKSIRFSKDSNIGSRSRVSATDIFAEAVDKEGKLMTMDKGGSADQYYDQTLKGQEGVVRQNLENEGASISPQIVKAKLVERIMNGGLEGESLIKALGNIDNEIEGLMIRANSDGNIPLEIIHDAKISTTKGLNYMTEPHVKTKAKSFAQAYKKLVEENSNEPIEAINKELSKFYKDIEYIKNLDGRRVKGGRLGKYFAQISGNLIGGAVGSVFGPAGTAIGTILGGEASSLIKGNLLSKTLGGKTGAIAKRSRILEKARKRGQSNKVGNLNTKYNATKIASNTGIPESIPQTNKNSLGKLRSVIEAREASARASGGVRNPKGFIDTKAFGGVVGASALGIGIASIPGKSQEYVREEEPIDPNIARTSRPEKRSDAVFRLARSVADEMEVPEEYRDAFASLAEHTGRPPEQLVNYINAENGYNWNPELKGKIDPRDYGITQLTPDAVKTISGGLRADNTPGPNYFQQNFNEKFDIKNPTHQIIGAGVYMNYVEQTLESLGVINPTMTEIALGYNLGPNGFKALLDGRASLPTKRKVRAHVANLKSKDFEFESNGRVDKIMENAGIKKQ